MGTEQGWRRRGHCFSRWQRRWQEKVGEGNGASFLLSAFRSKVEQGDEMGTMLQLGQGGGNGRRWPSCCCPVEGRRKAVAINRCRLRRHSLMLSAESRKKKRCVLRKKQTRVGGARQPRRIWRVGERRRLQSRERGGNCKKRERSVSVRMSEEKEKSHLFQKEKFWAQILGLKLIFPWNDWIKDQFWYYAIFQF